MTYAFGIYFEDDDNLGLVAAGNRWTSVETLLWPVVFVLLCNAVTVMVAGLKWVVESLSLAVYQMAV